MSMDEQFDAFRTNYSDTSPSYNSVPSQGSQMTRSLSHGNSAIESTLPPNLNPRLTGHLRDRQVPSPMNTMHSHRPMAVPYVNTNNLNPLPQTMQRSRSHGRVGHDQYQNFTPPQNDFNNPAINYMAVPWTAVDPAVITMQAPQFSTVFDNDQPRKIDKARTVAGHEPHSSRRGDFASPREAQPVPQEFRGNQDDVLHFVGSNTGADAVPAPSPYQGFEVNIYPACESSPNLEIQKRVEDVIHSFLAKHRSKGEYQALSDAELLDQLDFRFSLRGSDTVTSCDDFSIGPSSGAAVDPERSRGVKCPATNKIYFPCPECRKVKNRQSDLNKHMQRHSKPYGCVFDGCHKTFGSKNDWKRHEQTQHEQQECWRCHLCYELFFHEQCHWVAHMQEVHSTKHPEENAKNCRIARNYQGRFWCGFCQKIIVHSKTDVEAITLRFDHIAHHFTKENRASKDWTELSGKGKTKQQVHEEQSQSSTEEEGDVLNNSQSTSTSTQSSSSQQSDASPVQQTFSQDSIGFTGVQEGIPYNGPGHDLLPTVAAAGQHPRQSQQVNPKRRQAGRRERPADFMLCCYCRDTTSISLRSKTCFNCQHHFCTSCLPISGPPPTPFGE